MSLVDLGHSLEVPDILRSISAVAVALLDLDGHVLDANAGFCLLAGQDETKASDWNAASFFIQPNFDQITRMICHDHSNRVYEGILNIGQIESACRSVHGAVLRFKDRILVVGEHDIASLENLAATVVSLNEELAQTQRDLVKSNRELKRNQIRIQQLMLTDPLTDVANRRHYDQRIVDELTRSERYGDPFCLVMADIDHFKSVNDTYGHDVGDVVIRAFAQTLSSALRETDFVARMGGEEFVLLLINTQMPEAVLIVDRVRQLFGQLSYEAIDRPVTASFGVTAFRQGDSSDALLKKADQALYEAKRNGRNQVCTSLSVTG